MGWEGGGGMREWEEVHAGAYILFLNHFLGWPREVISALRLKPWHTLSVSLANIFRLTWPLVFRRSFIILENGVRSVVTGHAGTCSVVKSPISLYRCDSHSVFRLASPDVGTQREDRKKEKRSE